MDVAGALRAILGALLLAWLPGYAWVRVAFPHLDAPARLAASIGLSIVSVTLGLYMGNVLFGWRIGARSAAWIALSITLAAFVVPLARAVEARIADRLEPFK